MNGDVGMHHMKNSGTKSCLNDTIKDTSMHVRSCVTPLYINFTQAKGLRMIVLVSLIVLLRELLASTIFCMVHPYIASLFYTCIIMYGAYDNQKSSEL